MARPFVATYADLKPGDVIEHGIGRAEVTRINRKVPKHWPKNSAGVFLRWTSHRSVAQRLKGQDIGGIAVSLDWSVTVFR